MLRGLPFDFKAFKVVVDGAVIEDGNLGTVSLGAVPNVDLTHEAASSHQAIVVVTELALHQVLLEFLGPPDLNGGVAADSPDSGNHIRRAGQQLVACCIPVDRAHISVLIVPLAAYVRNLDFFESPEVFLAEVPQVSFGAVSCRGKDPVFRVELGEVDVPHTVAILTCLSEVDSELAVVF